MLSIHIFQKQTRRYLQKEIFKNTFDPRVYFLVHENGNATSLRTENRINIYISRIFGEILKKHTLQQKKKFSMKDFFSKCDQIRSFLRSCSHFLKKSLTENFSFCAMTTIHFCSMFYIKSYMNLTEKQFTMG